ncbi:MAG: hypothetical protein RLZZ519_3338 [Bacteroidota bacterium]|jgi:AAA15 family ATPase/GTPase
MLIRFTVENFLSFKDRVEFSMIPGKGRIHPDHILHVGHEKDMPVLKASMIYGANASGKSNLVKAIDFAKRFILEGTTREVQEIPFNHFRLDSECQVLNSRIEFEFNHGGKCYAYGFEFNRKAIVEEWLFEVFKSKKDRLIFERKSGEGGVLKINEWGTKLNAEEKQFLLFTAKGTRSNQLFLTECQVRNVRQNIRDFEDYSNVLDWFSNTLRVIFPNTKSPAFQFNLVSNDQLKSRFEYFLGYFGTGIEGVEMREVDLETSGISPKTLHDVVLDSRDSGRWVVQNVDGTAHILWKESGEITRVMRLSTKRSKVGANQMESFELPDESEGTQRLIDLIPALMELTERESVFVIDEIDRSLHPNLIYDFFDLFLKGNVGKYSQLIATTHESRLLSQKLMRKDEIWFMVKDKSGASSLVSLEEFKVRFDKEIRNDYLLGRFGGVPRFGNRKDLTVIEVKG